MSTANTSVDQIVVTVQEHELRGIIARPDGDPRAILLLLHGGGAYPEYYHAAIPGSSLVLQAQHRGHLVVALDRPGYGRGADLRHATPVERASMMFDALVSATGGLSDEVPVFLVAHSAGCALAMKMAASERGAHLLGLEIAGTGTQLQREAVEIFQGRWPKRDRDGSPFRLRNLLWGSADLYPPGTIEDPANVRPVWEAETDEIAGWPHEFSDWASQVQCAVHVSLGEKERWWSTGPEALESIAGRFTKSPFVATALIPDAAHNASLGHAALEYHDRVLDFVDSCLLRESAQRGAKWMRLQPSADSSQ